VDNNPYESPAAPSKPQEETRFERARRKLRWELLSVVFVLVGLVIGFAWAFMANS
jgi:cytochrome c biogenesis factor